MCNFLRNLTLVLSLSFSLFACTGNDQMERMPQLRTNVGKTLTLSMEGEIASNSELRTLDNSSIKFELEKKDERETFSLKYEDRDNVPAFVYFVNEATNDYFIARGTAQIKVKGDNGKPYITMHVEAETPEIVDSNWKIKPFIGMKESSESNNYFAVEQVDATPNSDNPAPISVPITSDFIRLTKSQINSGRHVDFKNVYFKPDGILLNFNVSSSFYDPVYVNKIINYSKTSVLVLGWQYDFSKGLNFATKPNQKSIIISDKEDTQGCRLYGLIEGGSSEANKNTLRNIFAWAKLDNINRDGIRQMQLSFLFEPYCRDPFKNKNLVYKRAFQPMYQDLQPVKEIGSSIQESKSYNINIKTIAKHPIISEVYISKSSDNVSIIGNKSSQSVVEIYNPTTKDIDLSNYVIIRMVASGALDLDDNGDEVYIPEGYPRGKMGTLILPLYLTDNKKLSEGHSITYNDSSNSFKTFGDDDPIHFYYKKGGDDRRMLKPGKTLVIGGPGYLKGPNSNTFDSGAYGSHASLNDDMDMSQKSNQIFFVANNSGYNNGNIGNGNDFEATLDMRPESGLALLEKVSDKNGKVAYKVIDVFPYDTGRKNKPLPFYMCRFDGIVYPYCLNDQLNDYPGIKNPTVPREGLNNQWFLDEKDDGETVHSFGARYRSW